MIRIVSGLYHLNNSGCDAGHKQKIFLKMLIMADLYFKNTRTAYFYKNN